ncbi:hypothetical protein ACQP1U_18300 [Actinomycetota bacterium]
MTPDDPIPTESITRLARRLLRTIDDTPIAAMDPTFYAHYFEELRLVVENLLTAASRTSAGHAQRVWLVWDCQDPVACYLSEQEAAEARADLQHQLRRDHGPDPDLTNSITISTAILELAARGAAWPLR